jgi:hypothetical protein
VALLGGYYYPGLRMDAMLAAMQRLPVLGTLMRHTVSPLLGRLMWPLTLKAVFSPGAVSDSLRRLPPWLVMRPSQLRATAEEGQLMVPSAARLQWRYAELTMPVTILAGDGDRVVDTQKQSVRLHEALPQSRLRTFAGKGHMLQHVVQREIAEELRALAATAGMRPAAAAPSAGPGPAVSAGMPASGTGMPAVGTGMPASGTGMPATGFSAAPDKQVDGRPVWHPDSSDAGNPLAH